MSKTQFDCRVLADALAIAGKEKISRRVETSLKRYFRTLSAKAIKEIYTHGLNWGVTPINEVDGVELLVTLKPAKPKETP